MKTYYVDIHLKNDEILETYFDTLYDEEVLCNTVLMPRGVYLITNSRNNGNKYIINKDQIVFTEILYEEEIENAERI